MKESFFTRQSPAGRRSTLMGLQAEIDPHADKQHRPSKNIWGGGARPCLENCGREAADVWTTGITSVIWINLDESVSEKRIINSFLMSESFMDQSLEKLWRRGGGLLPTQLHMRRPAGSASAVPLIDSCSWGRGRSLGGLTSTCKIRLEFLRSELLLLRRKPPFGPLNAETARLTGKGSIPPRNVKA